jgi:hypothetical protein
VKDDDGLDVLEFPGDADRRRFLGDNARDLFKIAV